MDMDMMEAKLRAEVKGSEVMSSKIATIGRWDRTKKYSWSTIKPEDWKCGTRK